MGRIMAPIQNREQVEPRMNAVMLNNHLKRLGGAIREKAYFRDDPNVQGPTRPLDRAYQERALAEDDFFDKHPPKYVGRTDEGRFILNNPDGTYSTEESATEYLPEFNLWLNTPTIFNGRRGSIGRALLRYKMNQGRDADTGRQLPLYRTREEAEQAARERSNSLGRSMR